MRSLELNRQLQRLEALMGRAPAAAPGDIELQAHWGRYLCVLAAGFLENAISEIYSSFAYRSASPAVASYASSRLSRIQNPKAAAFVMTARAFSKEWGDQLEKYLASDGRKEAIDGIMNLRHQIAHGRDAGITLARVREYLGKSVAVIEFLEGQCDGAATPATRAT